MKPLYDNENGLFVYPQEKIFGKLLVSGHDRRIGLFPVQMVLENK